MYPGNFNTNRIRSHACSVAAIVTLGCICAPKLSAQQIPTPNPVVSAPLDSFENASDLATIAGSSASVGLTTSGVTDGSLALAIRVTQGLWPNATIALPAAQNWTNYGGLDADLTNPNAAPLTVNMCLNSSPTATSQAGAETWTTCIQPGQTVHCTFAFPINEMAYGMHRLPAEPGGIRVESLSTAAGFDPTHIQAVRFYMNSAPFGTTLIVDNLRLPAPPSPYSLSNIIDSYGQFNSGTWTNKVTSDSDLVQRAQQDSAGQTVAPNPEWDSYGGWANGPAQQATGYFRTTKIGNRWWLVTPSGHLFFSLGVNSAYYWNSTVTSTRAYMFASLPNPATTPPNLYGTTTSGGSTVGTFDFYQANLLRKYGTKYQTAWQAAALNHMQNWGFNTIGNWSDPLLGAAHRMPYVSNFWVKGSFKQVTIGQPNSGVIMPDPFDPAFTTAANAAAKAVAPQIANDPWCLGYFVDNELTWATSNYAGNDIEPAIGILSLDKAVSPAKQQMVWNMAAKYVTIQALDKAWGTTFTSWWSLGLPTVMPSTATPAMRADLIDFTTAFASRYFAVVKHALYIADPNHLYLGCRFATYSPTVVQAAAGYCDVLSFNLYKSSIVPSNWSFLAAANKPCLVSEFSMGSLDSGMFHPGPVYVPNQAARAQAYQDYVDSVIAMPMFVGCHWFKYTDEPNTGRAQDGENENLGIVDITDTPYSDLTNAMTQMNRSIYDTIGASGQ